MRAHSTAAYREGLEGREAKRREEKGTGGTEQHNIRQHREGQGRVTAPHRVNSSAPLYLMPHIAH